MILEHIAIWTNQLEKLKDYYSHYFGGQPNKKYTNEKKEFFSYFLTFSSGVKQGLKLIHLATPGYHVNSLSYISFTN